MADLDLTAAIEAAWTAVLDADEAPDGWRRNLMFDSEALAIGVRAAAPLIAAAVRERLRYKAASCLRCRKPHQWRDLTPAGSLVESGTWGDPDDGHSYRPASLEATKWLDGQTDD